MADETTTEGDWPTTITPHSTSGFGTTEKAMLGRYIKANPLEYPPQWTYQHEEQYNNWLEGTHYDGYEKPEEGTPTGREDYMEFLHEQGGQGATYAFEQQKYREAEAAGEDMENWRTQDLNRPWDRFDVDEEMLARADAHNAAREGVEPAPPGLQEGVHYVDDGSRFVPSFGPEGGDFYDQQAAFWGVSRDDVIDGGLEDKTPAEYYAQLRKNAARGVFPDSSPSEAPPNVVTQVPTSPERRDEFGYWGDYNWWGDDETATYGDPDPEKDWQEGLQQLQYNKDQQERKTPGYPKPWGIDNPFGRKVYKSVAEQEGEGDQ